MRNKLANNTTNISVVLWGAIVSTVCLVVSLIALVRPLIMEEDAYRKVGGEIVDSFQTSTQYLIRLNTSREFYRINGRNNDVFREKAPIGGSATIWYRRTRGYRSRQDHSGLIIQKMIVNDEIIIPFNRRIGGYVFFVLISSLFLVLCIVDITKSRTGADL